MQTTIENKEIKYLSDRNSGKIISDITLTNIHFIGSSINYFISPIKSINRTKIFNIQKKRTIIRDIYINQCEQTGCRLHGVIAENVVINGLKTHNTFNSWATVYKHVIMKGKIGSIMISPNLFIVPEKKEEIIQSDFAIANNEYYNNIDWALDIREALFTTPIDIRGIPARLILRDTNTQAVIRLEKLKNFEWDKYDLSRSPWRGSIRNLLTFRWEDKILTVPQGAPIGRKKEYLDGIKELRDCGIADID